MRQLAMVNSVPRVLAPTSQVDRRSRSGGGEWAFHPTPAPAAPTLPLQGRVKRALNSVLEISR